MADGGITEAIPAAKRQRTKSSNDDEQRYKSKTLTLNEEKILKIARTFFPEEILKRKQNLACPVLLENPDRFAHVQNSCTNGNLDNIAHTKEHLDRVHVRKEDECPDCGHKFDSATKGVAGKKKNTAKKITEDGSMKVVAGKRDDREKTEAHGLKDLEQQRKEHEPHCLKKLPPTEPPRLSMEQDVAYKKAKGENWLKKGRGMTEGEKYRAMMRAIYPRANPTDIYHDPCHFFPTKQIPSLIQTVLECEGIMVRFKNDASSGEEAGNCKVHTTLWQQSTSTTHFALPLEEQEQPSARIRYVETRFGGCEPHSSSKGAEDDELDESNEEDPGVEDMGNVRSSHNDLVRKSRIPRYLASSSTFDGLTVVNSEMEESAAGSLGYEPALRWQEHLSQYGTSLEGVSPGSEGLMGIDPRMLNVVGTEYDEIHWGEEIDLPVSSEQYLNS